MTDAQTNVVIPEKAITDEETLIAFEGPAPYANRFFLHIRGAVGRIAFAEAPPIDGGTPVWRTAVTLSLEDLTALSLVLRDVLEKHPLKVRFLDEVPGQNV